MRKTMGQGLRITLRSALTRPEVYSRKVADRLFMIERHYPNLVSIEHLLHRPHAAGVEAAPIMRATVTAEGRAFLGALQ